MSRTKLLKQILAPTLMLACACSGWAATPAGEAKLKQAGPIAFTPEGVLLVGDSLSASVFAIETGEGPVAEQGDVNIEGVDEKIAAMVGSARAEIAINDMAVNPQSGSVYFSVARGRGPDATALIFKADHQGKLQEFVLDEAKVTQATFNDAPAADAKDRRGRPLRINSITDVQYTDGKVIVAGLSNEEFASKLRVLDFPFDGSSSSTSIEVYHGAHGRFETNSPVRTFITYENTVMAAYTCTPLVTIPVEDLKGDKIMGKTVAELGNRNTPLDMIIYSKGDQDYLLLNNTARGVMKLKLSKQDLDGVERIESKISGTAGLPYETVEGLEGVVQLDKLNNQHAVLLVSKGDAGHDLRTVALP